MLWIGEFNIGISRQLVQFVTTLLGVNSTNYFYAILCLYFNLSKVILEHVDHVAGSEDFERSISNFDGNFSHLLVNLLDKITELSVSNCEHKLMNILYRYL